MGTIVVTEDDQDIRELITVKLTGAGHQVTPAPDGAAGLIAARRVQPDLVVLDMEMPGLSGLDVLRLLRVDPATAAIPVLMVTSHSEPKYIAASFGSGASDFLAKPFSPRELTQRITDLLTPAEQPGQTTGTDTTGTATATADTITDAALATDHATTTVGRRGFLRLLTG